MLVKRLIEKPKKSFFLFGPRGTGKTTWIKRHFEQAVMIDLLDPELYRKYRANPNRLLYVIEGQTEGVIVIDEVQKVPELLSLVHKLIEEKPQLVFVLTGSSSRKLKKQGVDLLASRALYKVMHPFMASELAEFKLEERLRYGMLPIIMASDHPKEDLKSYLALYMREEVLQEGVIRNVDAFSQFLEQISFSQASTINVSNIARDCGVSQPTVDNYISILEDLLLAFKLPVFQKKAKRHLTSQPKFYYFDCGAYNAIRPKGPLDQPSEIAGHALETLVAQHLRAWIDYSNWDTKLYFWRTKAGLEVDFVIYGEQHFIAIEVKYSSQVRKRDLRPLKAFKKEYPISTTMLLYAGNEQLQIDGILCMPIETFLKNLKPNQAILHPGVQ